MSTGRFNHGTVLLANGKVLIAGGLTGPASVYTNSVELFDPATGTITSTGSLTTPRMSFGAILLPTGKVLVTGGLPTGPSDLATAELYDTLTGVWSLTGSPKRQGNYSQLTLLPNGRVLAYRQDKSAEVYDPATGVWTLTGELSTARAASSVSVLPNGKVLVAGGYDQNDKTLITAELYDPANGLWSPAPNMPAHRWGQYAVLLPSGLLLLASGGNDTDTPLKTTALYDSQSNTWSAGPEMLEGRVSFQATLLNSGRVLATGGYAGPDGQMLRSSEILATAAPTSGGLATVSAASFADNSTLAPEFLAAAFGVNLASGTEAASRLPLPTSLGGLSVRVQDSAGVERLSPLWMVSPEQINFNIPVQTSVGRARISVLRGDQMIATGESTVTAVSPGLFAANGSGEGAAAATAVHVRSDGSQTLEAAYRTDSGRVVTTPIDLGPETEQVVLVFYATGVRGRSSLDAVTATIGMVQCDVLYAGSSQQFPGVDQINVRLARALMGRGEADLVVTVDGRVANTLRVNIR
ncbi:MAG: kelch repeat-containing protein [Bryobacteraceae bacterium]